jgi:O-acetyl-ADP-ribose deacetylase (regulator of RNase III)
LGVAVTTSAGKLPYRAVIHVASINLWWRSSAQSIQGSVRSAMTLAAQAGNVSIAMPLIGAGTGGFGEAGTLKLMEEALAPLDFALQVTIVRFQTGQAQRNA